MWSTAVVAMLGMILVGGMLPVLAFQGCQRPILEIVNLNAPFVQSDVASKVTWSWVTVG